MISRCLPGWVLILFIFFQICKADGQAKNDLNKYQTSVHSETEFRAVWVATINNIDWPSEPDLSVLAQKEEFIQLLDLFEKYRLNVVIFQVRAASDAFYESKTEPWSKFLTGKQGIAPQPYWDPLLWAIEQCHSRDMELYAWFNPFRVRNVGHYPLYKNSFAVKQPEFVKEYQNKLFLDPGFPEVRKHLINVIAEVVNNYNVDGVLLDDYFYPYPFENQKFNDVKSFQKYGGEFFPKRLKDWRRKNIDEFISGLNDTIHIINPKVRLGISPFGIWRNKSSDPLGSSGVKGISSYDDLYADVRKWLMKDWIDYVIPQLYWEEGNRYGDFTTLLDWWIDNRFGKSLYIGEALYKSNGKKGGWRNPQELTGQINLIRQKEQVNGFAFYSASKLIQLSISESKELRDNLLAMKVKAHNPNQEIKTEVQTDIENSKVKTIKPEVTSQLSEIEKNSSSPDQNPLISPLSVKDQNKRKIKFFKKMKVSRLFSGKKKR